MRYFTITSTININIFFQKKKKILKPKTVPSALDVKHSCKTWNPTKFLKRLYISQKLKILIFSTYKKRLIPA